MWPDVLGVPPSAITDAGQHPSWQKTATDSRMAKNKDRDGGSSNGDRATRMNNGRVDGGHEKGGENGSGGAESKGRREMVYQGDTAGVASNSEREASVWVGWGGGCAF